MRPSIPGRFSGLRTALALLVVGLGLFGFGLSLTARYAVAAPQKFDGMTSPRVEANGDGTHDPYLRAVNTLYNGSDHELQRGNVEGTALASAARTATTHSPDITNPNGKGVIAYLNVTAASGTGGLTLRYAFRDPLSGVYANVNAAPTPVTAVGGFVYVLYPGATGGGTQVTGGPAPRTFRISVFAADGSSYTYSVSYCLLN